MGERGECYQNTLYKILRDNETEIKKFQIKESWNKVYILEDWICLYGSCPQDSAHCSEYGKACVYVLFNVTTVTLTCLDS